MRVLRLIAAVCILFTASSAADNPFIGSWKLVPERTKFAAFPPPPKSLTMTFQPDGEKVRLIVTGVTAEGKPIRDENSFAWDGKFHPGRGPTGPGRVSVTRVSDHENKVTIEVSGKQVLNIQSVVSKDRKTLTNATEGVGPNGERTHSVEVFEKQ